MLTPSVRLATGGQKKDWREIASRKKAERQSRLPEKWLVKTDDLPSDSVLDVTQLCASLKWLNEEELLITGLSAVELAAAVKEKRYSAVEVVKAYAHRATIAQQLVNPYVSCIDQAYGISLTEINFEQAINEASELDKHLETTGSVVGPMHGVPISVKVRLA
jgi:amidase